MNLNHHRYIRAYISVPIINTLLLQQESNADVGDIPTRREKDMEMLSRDDQPS